MKKTLLLIIALVALVNAQVLQSVIADPNNVGGNPGDIVTLRLTDTDVADANDTLAADEYNLYGPYKLAMASGMYKGFQAYFPKTVVASGDSLELSYQLLPTTSLSDTLAEGSWTVVDTVDGATGKVMAYVDLSSTSGNTIVFKVKNLDSTEAVIAKPIRISMKLNKTYNEGIR